MTIQCVDAVISRIGVMAAAYPAWRGAGIISCVNIGSSAAMWLSCVASAGQLSLASHLLYLSSAVMWPANAISGQLMSMCVCDVYKCLNLCGNVWLAG